MAALRRLPVVFSLFICLLYTQVRQNSGSSQARQERSRRNVGISKEGICPAWSVLRNCSLSSTCKKDNECSDKQKCCEDACGHHACFEAVLPLTADEEACLADAQTVEANKRNSKCLPTKTRFCYREDCRRCCLAETTCNPNPRLLIPQQACRKVLCSEVSCEMPGEVCVLGDYNRPTCICRSRCPRPLVGEDVCGSDGMPYKSECNLNRTSCILARKIVVQYRGKCRPNGVRLRVSAHHQKVQTVSVNEPGKVTCAFDGKPIMITWQNLALPRLPSRMVPRRNRLYISRVRTEDSGKYSCRAYDGFNVAEATVDVMVTVKEPLPTQTPVPTLDRAQCVKPPIPGHCQNHVIRWYFDGTRGVCEPFVYSGCGGNENNFPTKESCQVSCGHAAGDVCSYPMLDGPCSVAWPRWYYNAATGRCQRFMYGGCQGNVNRFATKQECEGRCPGKETDQTDCQRHRDEALGSEDLGVFVPSCRADGSYEPEQCHAALCFCIDQQGVEIAGSRVPRHSRPNCRDGSAVFNTPSTSSQCELARRNVSMFPFGTSHVPSCRQDGRYEEVQCSGLTGHCWCVDSRGQALGGTSTRGPLMCPTHVTSGASSTLCQRQYMDKSRSRSEGAAVPRCRWDGSFDHVQCHGDTCYCVDVQTGTQIPGTALQRELGEPRCHAQADALTPCQRQHQAGGEPRLQCTPDGRFDAVQCEPANNTCYCADQHGKEVSGTRTQRPLMCPSLDLPLTPCQSEYQRNLRQAWRPFTQFAPGCTPDGGYREVQCASGACYCVDQTGAEVPGTRVFSAARAPDCSRPGSNLTPCEMRRRAVLLLPATLHEFVPHCKPDGDWGEIQCHATSGECWCVDEEGLEILNTRSNGQVTCPKFANKLSPCMKRYFYTLKSSISRRNLPWCKPDGSYNEMQCLASYCYCVDQQGNPIPGTKSSMSVGKPACTSKGGSLTPCQVSYINAPLMYFLGRAVARCKQDGSFEEVQCGGNAGHCWCVDSDGKEIPRSRTTGSLKCPIMGPRLSRCQQQRFERLKNPAPDRLVPHCNPDGSFAHVQCQQLDCFCVDKNGNEITGTRLTVDAGKPRCKELTNGDSRIPPRALALTRCQMQNRNRSSHPSVNTPRCKTDGSFEEVQCSRATGACWCVDSEGREILGTNTSGYLKCPSEALQLTPCQTEYQAIARNWAWLGPTPPQCDSDGKYSAQQCQTTHCFCVNKHGVELEGTRVPRRETGQLRCELAERTLTLCQKQFQDFLKRPKRGQYQPRCTKTGDYHQLQCKGPECFCVNRTGHEVPASRRNMTDGNPICRKQGLILTPCQQLVQEAMQSPPTPGKFVPRCKADGDYEVVQCDPYTKNCWCATPDGTVVQGTNTTESVSCPSADVDTPCWKHYQDALRTLGAGGFVPRCGADGSYEPIQAQGPSYFCMNSRGVAVRGSAVPVQLGRPACRFEVSPGLVQTPCQRWRTRLVHLPLLAGRHVPRCTANGRYDNMQCDDVTRHCWCVSKDGLEVLGTRRKGTLKCPPGDALTHCQKRQSEALSIMSHAPVIGQFVPRCQSDGRYERIQCHGGSGQCWCVDRNGIELPGTAVRGGQPDCSVKVKQTACQHHRQRAQGLTGRPPPGRYVPTCDDDGSYRRIQCQASSAPCWCVDKDGEEIVGTKQWGIPTCDPDLSGRDVPLNLAFLLDSSVSARDWQTLLDFAANFLDAFTISTPRTHVGVVVYSTHARVALKFNTLEGGKLTAAGVKQVLRGLVYQPGSNRLDRGLLKAEDIFSEAQGMRSELPKVLVVLTSGRQTTNKGPYTPLHAASQGLKDRGVHIYVIGIGNDVAVPELMDVSSTFRDVFLVHEASTLLSRALVVRDVVRNSTAELTNSRLCNLAPKPGELGCLASITAWYYDSSATECQQFVYSGCGGNANNFASRLECRKACQGVLPACAQERLQRIVGLEHFNPRCQESGQYKRLQCYGATDYCWCVNEHGSEVPGTRVMGTPVCSMIGTSLTPCLEERREALGWFGIPTLGRFVPECEPNGDFADVQCFDSTGYCWCVDKDGREISGTHRWGTPNCAVLPVRDGACPHVNDTSLCPPRTGVETCAVDSDCPLGSKCCECGCSSRCAVAITNEADTPACLRELRRASSCPHARAPGHHVPACKPDGTYEEVQCDVASGYCWCVDSHGNEIPGSRQETKPENCTALATLTPCQRDFMRSLAMRKRRPIGFFFPVCEADGSFRSLQCHAATGFCWCVDRRGSEITGTRQWGELNCTARMEAPNVATVCQTKQEECLEEEEPLNRFIPLCNEDGSFKQLQCQYRTGECWCVDRYGQEIPDTRSRHKPDCSVLAWLSPCQIRRRQALGAPNVPLVGVFVPECRADGGYQAVQCHRGHCWCVGSGGAEVPGTRTRGRPNCDKLQSCLNDRAEALGPGEATPPGRHIPQCHPKGGYQAQQCHAATGVCWCVDEYGNELESTRGKQPINCTAAARQKLSLCHSRHNKAMQARIPGQLIPHCTPDGAFASVQCDELSGECWCVDRNGAEREGSRARGRLPSCSEEATDPTEVVDVA